jgi:hypothetical protein
MAAHLTGRDVQCAILLEGGRQGVFVFDDSDLSAQVAVDPRQGLYVAPASDSTGASGAWVRIFDDFLMPQWFGWSGTDLSSANAALHAAWETMLTSGKPLRLPNGECLITSPLRAPVSVNGEVIRLHGDGQYKSRIINGVVGGAPLIDLGDSLFSELHDFSIIGNAQTGVAGNGHAIIGWTPNPGVGTFVPQLASIRRVRVTDHRGTGAKHGGGTIPAQALYFVGALGCVVEHFYCQHNGGGIYSYKTNQLALNDVTCDGNYYNGIVNDQSERMIVTRPDLVGGNDQSSGGTITVYDGTVVRAGDFVDYFQHGGAIIYPKIKNSVYSALSCNSPEPVNLIGGWVALDVIDGVHGVHSTKQVKITGTEFSRFGPMAAGTRHDIYLAPSGGYRDIGLISGTHHDYNGGGVITSVITIDGAAGSSSTGLIRGVIRDVTIGTATSVASATTVTDAVKLVGYFGNLTLDNIRVQAPNGVTINTAFNFAGANTTDHGFVFNNCSAIVPSGSAGVVTRETSGTLFAGYRFGLTSAGLQFTSGRDSGAIRDVLTKEEALQFNAKLTDASWTLLANVTLDGDPVLKNALIAIVCSDGTPGLQFDYQITGAHQLAVYATCRRGILSSYTIRSTEKLFIKAIELRQA